MRSKTLLVAGLGAALIALAGCGGGTVTGSATPQGGAGAQQQGGAQPGGGQKITTVGDLGALVQHNASNKNSAHMTMSMDIGGMGAINASGDIRFDGTQSAEQMTMTLPGMGDMQMIVIGTTTYMKIPSGLAGVAGGSGDGKPWMKLDVGGDDALSKSLGSTAGLADQTDPTQLINNIAKAGTITHVTQDEVDGAPATHYTITVDVQKMLATMGGSADDAQKQAMSALGLKTMPFDIWVNGDNLPVKITTDLAFANPASSGAPSQVNMTVNYTKWGESVNIAPPPADQVGTMGGN
ncbi:MAG TPA: hypothetical protein VH333_18185 [Pseudonocardiaceae bacterium]|jgi:hypothetical protein|nr:hypothetical protein [Pseudonocardiaceae bacterium]